MCCAANRSCAARTKTISIRGMKGSIKTLLRITVLFALLAGRFDNFENQPDWRQDLRK
jgi:hypothetical protein